jgi:diketogulonate reductase-like aldo/keto reductase
VITIPKAVTLAHLRQNVDAGDIQLDDDDLALIDAALPPPSRKHALETV